MKTADYHIVDGHNPGGPFDIAWINDTRLDASAIERDSQSLAARIALSKESQRSLLRAISVMDLTTLADDDTDDRVRRLCQRAREPLPPDLIGRLGADAAGLQVAAVCIYPRFVKTALEELEGTSVKVATVSADFPKGRAPLQERIAQIHDSVQAGAQEIDVVINRAHALQGDWQTLYDEVAAFKAACARRPMKVILGTGELQNFHNIARASRVALMAGADFIKTSTGKETVNATLAAGLIMTRAIRDYARKTGVAVGFKPAGGIRNAKQALEYLSLVEEELGARWLQPGLFRIGASSLLDDIGGQLRSLG